MSNWHVGQKIVCIKNTFFRTSRNREHKLHGIVVDQVYTVAAIDPVGGLAGIVCLKEIHGVKFQSNGDLLGYPIPCFRPLIDKKTDITVFTEMLNPALDTTSLLV